MQTHRIAVALADPEYSEFQEARDLPAHRLEILRRFFLDDKALQEKHVKGETLERADSARSVIDRTAQRYRKYRRTATRT